MNSFVEFEESAQLADVLDRVERGEQVTVMRHGRPVATIAPAVRSLTPEQIAKGAAARDRLFARREEMRREGIAGWSPTEVREAKGEGRA